jgi:mannan endo-1,4-beta-mannosidase
MHISTRGVFGPHAGRLRPSGAGFSTFATSFCAIAVSCSSTTSRVSPLPQADAGPLLSDAGAPPPDAVSPPSCAGPAPADPQASAETRAVFAYLASLPSRSDKRVLSGQKYRFPQWDWDPILSSGYTPALMAVGYVCGGGTNMGGCAGKPFLHEGLLQTMADHFHGGGLVQIDESIGNPKTNGGVGDTAFTQSDFDHLLTPGDPVQAAYLTQLDVIAAGYQFLQTQGVVVLVHGLPEMNGTWLWWSQGTPEQYKALFRMEFDYLTKEKGLHNLLFTYAPNAGNGKYADYYPGDSYVDIVGVDYYLDVEGAIPKPDGYDQLTSEIAPCKPFGLIEFGPLPGGSAVTFSPRDYHELIVSIRETMPRVTYWQSWNGIWGMGIADYTTGQSHLNVGQLLADPWVVNLGDITLPLGPVQTAHPVSEVRPGQSFMDATE